MAEDLTIDFSLTKAERYQQVLPQIQALITGEPDLIANLANISAALKEAFGFFWVGFYINNGSELVLGPFQGPVACTRIPFHKGVCGACFTQKQTIVVPDVESFPGHIACSSASKSEIVVPVFKNGDVALVLDVDSDALNDFDTEDAHYLEQLMRMLEETFT